MGDQKRGEEVVPWGYILSLFGAVLLIGILVGLIPWVTFAWNPEWAKAFPAAAGLWGDSFGFVNALLSSLAFAGVLVTLWMQRRELQLQREEMKLNRAELEATREEHQRMAAAQEASENRLFLAAYMNALESLRQFSQWRMTADPTRATNASFPVVEGLVIQARVSESLQVLVRDLEPEIHRIHPSLTPITAEGSWVWRLEQLLNVYISIGGVIESYQGSSDTPSSFEEAVNIARLQFNRLRELRRSCGPHWHADLDALLTLAPDPNNMVGDILSPRVEARNIRSQYFDHLKETNQRLLSFVMRMCREQ